MNVHTIIFRVYIYIHIKRQEGRKGGRERKREERQREEHILDTYADVC